MEKSSTFALTSITTAMKDDTGPYAPMTVQEEKELQRVFCLLRNFHIKNKIRLEISDLENWIASIKLQEQHPETSAMNLITGNSQILESTHVTTEAHVEELRQQLLALEPIPRPDGKVDLDGKIYPSDVLEMFKFLDKKISRNEAEEMIWEVDEDVDGAVSWPEFRLMFGRNITDRTGLEPSRLFNLAQYLIYDHNQNGKVSVDGTMHMLYARYGRTKMEVKLKELFGEDMHESGREGGEITFSKYLNAVEKIQIQTFCSTTKGKIALSKDTFKLAGTGSILSNTSF